ncbi:MAG: DUF192 domain-containing protein [Pseudomonadaceae bacterium]|nr:DUF192 domain-containing protein [Pseudomonadaceae bacterium]
MRCLAVLLMLANVAQALPLHQVELTSPDGKVRHRLTVEVADTDATRQQGLMHRTKLADDAGMLFVYPDRPGGDTIYMWMRNTLIPLDMLFVQNDTVAAIHAGAVPHDETVIASPPATTAVLEVNGGWADAKGVTAGWRLRLLPARRVSATAAE